ncbi:Tmem207, partial [Columba livia]
RNVQRSFKSFKLRRVKHCCKQSSSHVFPASDAETWSFVFHFMDHRNWSSVFNLLAGALGRVMRTLAAGMCASEAPQCPLSGSPRPCMTAEMSSSPASQFSLGGTDLPPSYEDIMKENKL